MIDMWLVLKLILIYLYIGRIVHFSMCSDIVKRALNWENTDAPLNTSFIIVLWPMVLIIKIMTAIIFTVVYDLTGIAMVVQEVGNLMLGQKPPTTTNEVNDERDNRSGTSIT